GLSAAGRRGSGRRRAGLPAVRVARPSGAGAPAAVRRPRRCRSNGPAGTAHGRADAAPGGTGPEDRARRGRRRHSRGPTTPHCPAPAHPVPPPARDPAHPVFSRYWLHNPGPAPVGNLPTAVHLSAADASGRYRITVAASARPAEGTVRLDVPPGLTAAATGP